MNKTKEMKMLRIVTTPRQAIENIVKFERELQISSELQARLSYARAWYAWQDEESGKWFFAPSKFAGYQAIDAKTYIHGAEESDGRRTEVQLQMWFSVVDLKDSLYEELNSLLVAMLARFGKTPSTKTRINVVRARRKLKQDQPRTVEVCDQLVSLMVQVAKTLPTEQFQSLRDQLDEIWA